MPAADQFDGKYVSLTSFRHDGSAVATPMWYALDDGHLFLETDGGSYKMKRIRRDPHVRVAPCDARGRLRGEPVEADARILPDAERERSSGSSRASTGSTGGPCSPSTGS
jgi:uncharacterized protein